VPSDDPDDTDTPRRPTLAELRQHRWTYPRGVPALAVEPDDMPESEGSLYDEPIRPSRRDVEACQRAGREPDAHVRSIELSAVLRVLESRHRQICSVQQETAQTVNRLCSEVDGTPGRPGLTETVADHTEVIRPVRATASWALRGTIAAIIVVGGFLYQRGSAEQHTTDELTTLKRDYERLEKKFDALQTQIQGPRP
jgi:hypothetical protein